MSYVSPHCKTLIFDFGSNFTKVGYVGEFHPIVFFNTPKESSLCDLSCSSIEKFSKEQSVDSAIILETEALTFEDKAKILKHIFANKIVNSILFLNKRVAEAFGAGKCSGIVWRFSNSVLGVFVIINGKLVESFTASQNALNGKTMIMEKIQRSPEILTEVRNTIGGNTSDLKFIRIVESKDCVNMLQEKYNLDAFEGLRESFSECVTKISEFRIKYSIQKKNTSNGCILMTGGYFKTDAVYEEAKGLLVDKIGVDFNDFILRDRELINSFFGASVFGANNQTKMMYITAQDWQNIGSDIIKLKSF